jgi:hypothetical protein
VPYSNNLDFVGRLDVLQQLKDKLDYEQWINGTSVPRVSLFGLGGIGYML